MVFVQQLSTSGISCHSWNGDRTMLALCPNNNEIHIYEVSSWKKLFVLPDHDLLVSSLDWSAANNKIVSCSHDRNAFVWTYHPQTKDEHAVWKPALVILRIDRAGIDVRWDRDGSRFVTSASKCVPVCTYELANDWWVSKMIKKKFKSTVLCCAFHPSNSQIIATGSCDFKCRIYSTYIPEVDGSSVNSFPFDKHTEFGEVYLELTALGWINAVAWSPTGTILAFAGQDSSVHFCTFTESGHVTKTVRFPQLPLMSLMFISEKSIIGGGYDFNPFALSQTNDSEWIIKGFLDDTKKSKGSEIVTKSSASAARDIFMAKASTGQDKKKDGDVLNTTHENVINCIRNAGPSGGSISSISTSSLDGKLVVWNFSDISNIDLTALQI